MHGNQAATSIPRAVEATLNERLNKAAESFNYQCDRIEAVLSRVNGTPSNKDTRSAGSVAQINAVKKLYKVYGEKKALDEAKGLAGGYGMDHSSVMYLMGPDGKIVSYYDELIPAAKLEAELREKAK